MKVGITMSSLLAVLLFGATGCNVKVDKSGDGDNVKIATPFGGIAVKKDQTSAADLGLPGKNLYRQLSQRVMDAIASLRLE